MNSTKYKEQILVVDDAQDTLEVIERNLTAHGYRILTAPAVAEAIEILESIHIDLVITDLKMPGASGLDLVRHIRENYKNIEVMMITGYATINGAVEAVKTGAEEYLAKPFTDEELLLAVRTSIEKLRLCKAGEFKLDSPPKSRFGMIGQSESMKKVFNAITKASATIATVLITGESGTGKELVARAVHYNSPRSSAAFLPVNCGGIPETLLESELFGHVKGAFTGASESRAGFFQTADGGTIFLDEISEMSMTMQVKLLRVLQNREICMVGSSRTQKVNVRIIAASNKDILNLIKKGIFRDDLFFRLNIIPIDIPPLRERNGDIPLLIHHFASKYSKEFGKAIPKFTDKALHVLENYYWSGNVRELENVIQRLVVMMEEDLLDVPDLPSLMRYSVPYNNRLNRTLAEVEAEYIRNVINSVDGNKSRAAEILGIDRKTLRRKIEGISQVKQ